jgi:riboflavin transporter 2
MLIAIMNLSAWIDLQGLFVEIPLIIPFTPERWTLPSIAAICVCGANIVPLIVVILRWRQGKRFSEIPYIYMIIIIGVIACFVLALLWQKTVFLFGRERSVWLLGCIFILSMLDCTSSLVFFDYMKHFRTEYLRAVFLGEALTSVIPTLLILAQGVAGETICIQSSNNTILEPTYTQPRFSVRIFMFCIAGIISASLIAFILLRWTNIVTLANAAEMVSS